MSEVVLCALITGVFALLTARTNARGAEGNKEILARLERLEKIHHEDSVISERNDLLMAIRIDPDNTREIMIIDRKSVV